MKVSIFWVLIWMWASMYQGFLAQNSAFWKAHELWSKIGAMAYDAYGSFELLVYVGKKKLWTSLPLLKLKAGTADPPWVVPPLMSHELAKWQLIAALATIRLGFKRPICMRNNKFFTRSRFWLCWQALIIEPKITISASKESSAGGGQVVWFQR